MHILFTSKSKAVFMSACNIVSKGNSIYWDFFLGCFFWLKWYFCINYFKTEILFSLLTRPKKSCYDHCYQLVTRTSTRMNSHLPFHSKEWVFSSSLSEKKKQNYVLRHLRFVSHCITDFLHWTSCPPLFLTRFCVAHQLSGLVAISSLHFSKCNQISPKTFSLCFMKKSLSVE